MSLKEDTLWDTWILDSWLNDVESIIIQVKVDDAFSHTVVFVLVLNDWLKEVTFEVEDLWKGKGENWIKEIERETVSFS